MRGRKTTEGRRAQVLDAFRAAGERGLTTDELEAVSGVTRNSGSGRTAELKRLGLIKDSGRKRPSNKGKSASVWVICDGVEIPDVIDTPERPLPKVTNSPKVFWRELRRQLLAFVKQSHPNIDDGTWAVYAQEMDADLRGIVSHFTNRIARAKALSAVVIPRRRMLDACDTLRVPPPAMDQPVDLEVAKKNKRHASRLYHPDAHGGGTEHTRSLFEAAIEAYDVLEQYNQTLRSNSNGR